MYFLLAMLVSLAGGPYGPSRITAWGCVLSGAFGGMAFLVKQPGIAVLIAIAAVWLLHKRFRNVVLLSLGAAA